MAYHRNNFKALLNNKKPNRKQHKQYIHKDRLSEYESILTKHVRNKETFIFALLQLLAVQEPILYNSIKWRNRNDREGRVLTQDLYKQYISRLFSHEKIEKNKFVAEIQQIIVELRPNYYSAVYGMID